MPWRIDPGLAMQSGSPPAQVLIDSSGIKAHRYAAGGKGGEQSGERSLAGGTTEIHAPIDYHCRPIAFLLTGGQVADCTSGAEQPIVPAIDTIACHREAWFWS